MKAKRTRNTSREVVEDPKPIPDDLEAEVARRAYALFERRGGEPGHDLEDWLEAERSLREETLRPS